MNQVLISAGIVLIGIGFVLVFVGSFLQAKGESKVEWGFGGFIGPIPIGFGSSKKMVYFAVALAVVMLILFLLFRRFH